MESNQSKKTGAIIFPKSKYVCLDGHGGINDRSYCNHVRNYPSKQELESILKNQFSTSKKYIYEDRVQSPMFLQRSDDVHAGETEMCDSHEKVVYPQSGVTKDDTWMLILNDDDAFKQGVLVEECVNAEGSCKAVSLPNQYNAKCEQKYNLRTLWGITDNQTRVLDSFKMPSCCKCVLKWHK